MYGAESRRRTFILDQSSCMTNLTAVPRCPNAGERVTAKLKTWCDSFDECKSDH
jgi:hypothetical protein